MTGRAVTVRLDGETVTIEVADDEYLLDVAEATALSPQQQSEGSVLLCCSSLGTDCEIRAGECVQHELLGARRTLRPPGSSAARPIKPLE